MELCQGRGSWGLGTPQGGGHGTKLPQHEGCLDSALRHKVWILGAAACSQELDLTIPVSPFQLRIFYDDMILRFASVALGLSFLSGPVRYVSTSTWQAFMQSLVLWAETCNETHYFSQ